MIRPLLRLLVALALSLNTAAGKALKAANATPEALNAAIVQLRGGRTADTARPSARSSSRLKRCGSRPRCLVVLRPSSGRLNSAPRRQSWACRQSPWWGTRA